MDSSLDSLTRYIPGLRQPDRQGYWASAQFLGQLRKWTKTRRTLRVPYANHVLIDLPQAIQQPQKSTEPSIS